MSWLNCSPSLIIFSAALLIELTRPALSMVMIPVVVLLKISSFTSFNSLSCSVFCSILLSMLLNASANIPISSVLFKFNCLLKCPVEVLLQASTSFLMGFDKLWAIPIVNSTAIIANIMATKMVYF